MWATVATKQVLLCPGRNIPGGFVVDEERGAMGWGGEGRALGKACKGPRKGEKSKFMGKVGALPARRCTRMKHRHLTRLFSRATSTIGTAWELVPAIERGGLQSQIGASAAPTRPWQQPGWEQPAQWLQQGTPLVSFPLPSPWVWDGPRGLGASGDPETSTTRACQIGGRPKRGSGHISKGASLGPSGNKCPTGVNLGSFCCREVALNPAGPGAG